MRRQARSLAREVERVGKTEVVRASRAAPRPLGLGTRRPPA
jgi:hypothetical protein